MAGETLAVRSFHVAMHCTGCTTCRCNTHRLCLDATSIIWQYPPPPGWGNLTTLLLLFGCALYRVRYVSLQYPSPFFFLTRHHHFVAVPAVPWLGNLSNSFPLCGRALYRVCCTSCNTQRLSLLRCHHQYVAVPGISCLGKPSQFAPFISPCIVQGVLYVPAVPIACFSLCGMTILWQYPPSPGWGNLGSSFLPCSRAMYSMH